MEKVVAVSLKSTHFSCPSKWEGKFNDGKAFQASFRKGNFVFIVDGTELMNTQKEDDQGGFMSTYEMQRVTKELVNWENVNSNGPIYDHGQRVHQKSSEGIR